MLGVPRCFPSGFLLGLLSDVCGMSTKGFQRDPPRRVFSASIHKLGRVLVIDVKVVVRNHIRKSKAGVGGGL